MPVGAALLQTVLFKESRQSGGTSTPAPTTNIDFRAVDGAGAGLPAGSTFTRASTATRVNQRGYLEEVLANAMRPTYDPALVYNEVPNPWCVGGGAGSMPTGWLNTNISGMAWTFVGVTVEDGVPCFDARWSGTAAVTNSGSMRPAGVQNIPAATGDVFTSGVGIRIVAGSMANINFIRLNNYEINSVGGTVAQDGATGLQFTPTAVFQDIIKTRTFSGGATVVSAAFGIEMSLTAGAVVDITLRFRMPCMNKGATSLLTSPGYAVIGARTNNNPTYGCLGLLLEEATTNVITNPRCEGAVVGTPGTLPTSWSIGAIGGITTSVVAIGVEGGISYVDLSFVGTPAVTGNHRVSLRALSGAAAAVSQVWTTSAYVRLIAGALTNVQVQVRTEECDSGGGILTFGAANITPAGAALKTQRFSQTRTLANASVANVGGDVNLAVTSGQAINLTLRIGFPQVEQQPFPTSVTLPAVGTPTASTRARDAIAFPTTLLNMTQSSWAMRFALARNGSAGEWPVVSTAMYCGDATAANETRVITQTGGVRKLSPDIRTAAATVMTTTGPTVAGDTMTTTAMAWGGGSGRIAFDGATPTEDTDVASPGAATIFRLNDGRTGAGGMNIVAQFLRIWSGTKLTAQQVQKESGKTA